MSDEKREQLEPQNNTELTSDAPMSNEISDQELDNITGGDGANGGAANPPSTPSLYKSTAKGTHYKEVKLL